MTISRGLSMGFAVMPMLVLAVHWSQPATPKDPVAALQADVVAGRTKLTYDAKFGYLPSLLDALKVPVNSQTLVFSRTSLQTDFISRKNPRAIYFNRDVYIGYIPGAPLIEIMSVDPLQGTRFYTLPNLPENRRAAAFSTDDSDCVRCHGGQSLPPRLFVRSVHAAPSGYARPFAPNFNVMPRTPIRQRWGGWYVTGRHGTLRHMGNVASEGTDEQYRIDVEAGANLTELPKVVDRTKYPIAHSDILALLELEKQMDVQNELSWFAMEARDLLKDRPSEAVGRRRLRGILGELVRALRGDEDVEVPTSVRGTSGFRPTPWVKVGNRSVHFLIESPTFRAMPELAQRTVRDALSQ
ncbi:MAG: hypothetical protein SFX74_06485 [Fimbriimonadaceae bacterium]|nr:hypothetical protein [Fimbriimonadaceae bacterium]